MVKTKDELVEALKALGYVYDSTNYYGYGCQEVWYEHPSGSHINLDDSYWHDVGYLNRKLEKAPHSIRIHEFEKKATAAAETYAADKGMYASRHYYLGCADGEQDWLYRINTSQFGTTLEYKRGKDFLPKEYEEVADSFRYFAPK